MTYRSIIKIVRFSCSVKCLRFQSVRTCAYIVGGRPLLFFMYNMYMYICDLWIQSKCVLLKSGIQLLLCSLDWSVDGHVDCTGNTGMYIQIDDLLAIPK